MPDRARSYRAATRQLGVRPAFPLGGFKGRVSLWPYSGCREDIDESGLQFLGGDERPIVLKFTGAAIDLDRIESHPCRRQLVAKSVEQCVFPGPIVRKNHAVLSTHNRLLEQSFFVIEVSTKKLCEILDRGRARAKRMSSSNVAGGLMRLAEALLIMADLSAAPIILTEIFLLIAARLGSDAMILGVAARNSLAPQVAHFDDNVATDKAGELGKKAPLTAESRSVS